MLSTYIVEPAHPLASFTRRKRMTESAPLTAPAPPSPWSMASSPTAPAGMMSPECSGIPGSQFQPSRPARARYQSRRHCLRRQRPSAVPGGFSQSFTPTSCIIADAAPSRQQRDRLHFYVGRTYAPDKARKPSPSSRPTPGTACSKCRAPFPTPLPLQTGRGDANRNRSSTPPSPMPAPAARA